MGFKAGKRGFEEIWPRLHRVLHGAAGGNGSGMSFGRRFDRLIRHFHTLALGGHLLQSQALSRLRRYEVRMIEIKLERLICPWRGNVFDDLENCSRRRRNSFLGRNGVLGLSNRNVADAIGRS